MGKTTDPKCLPGVLGDSRSECFCGQAHDFQPDFLPWIKVHLTLNIQPGTDQWAPSQRKVQRKAMSVEVGSESYGTRWRDILFFPRKS